MAPPRADWLGMQAVMDGVDSSVWEWGTGSVGRRHHDLTFECFLSSSVCGRLSFIGQNCLFLTGFLSSDRTSGDALTVGRHRWGDLVFTMAMA